MQSTDEIELFVTKDIRILPLHDFFVTHTAVDERVQQDLNNDHN